MKDEVNLLGVGVHLRLDPSSPIGRFLCRLAIAATLCAVLSTSAWCQGALPEFFGIYAVVDGKLASMIGGKGTFTPNQTGLQVYNFQKMSGDTQNVFGFEAGEVHFLVFDAAAADTSASLELYKLPYARNLITRPGGLAQVGGLLDQVSGRTGRGGKPPASPLQRYVVAKTDALKVELLQKPVSGQPQMVQLVPASKLEAGVYTLFAIRMQGGQQYIVGQLFELKGPLGSTATPYCIDLAVTGGFGGAMDESDARLARLYYLAKERYVTCGESSTSAPPNTSAPPSVPGGNVAGGSVGSVAPAACGEYTACLQTAKNAYKSRDWSNATAAFRAAATQNSASGEPWVWLGRVLLRDGQSHHLQELSQVWDKALSLGAELMIGACHDQALRPCERGDLSLSSKSVSFLASGSRTVFAAAPGEIEPGRILNNSGAGHIAYSLRVAGKNYSIEFIPLGATCTVNLMVQCPQHGITEQLIVAEYVSQALPRLARGMVGR